MKLILSAILILLSASTIGQTSRHYFSFSVSNNGQLGEIADEYYFSGGDDYGPNNDVSYYKQNELKWNLAYQYLNNKSILLGIQYGHQKRTDEYVLLNTPNANGTKSQTIHNLSLSALYQYSFDRFSLAIGPSIPLFIFDEYSDDLLITDTNKVTESNYSLDLGLAYGINLKTSLLFFATKHLFFSTTIEFGFLHAELGGEADYSVHETTSTSSQNTYHSTYSSPFTKNFFTKPELHLGIGYKF